MIQVAIRSNLRVLHSLKEAAEMRRISYNEINEATGIAESTISQYMNDKIKYFDRDTLDRFCSYYNCDPGDIIVRYGNGQLLEGVAN